MRPISSTSSSEGRRLAARLLRFAPIGLCVSLTNALLDQQTGRSRGELESLAVEDVLAGRDAPRRSNERDFQRRFFERVAKPREVVVIGSSRCMAVGSRHVAGRTLWNASVPAAGLEDVAVLYGFASRSRLAPRTVLIGMDVTHFVPPASETRWIQRTFVREFAQVGAEMGVNVVTFVDWSLMWAAAIGERVSPSYFQRTLFRAVLRADTRATATANGPVAGVVRRVDGSLAFPPRLSTAPIGRPEWIAGWGSSKATRSGPRGRALAILDGLVRRIRRDGRTVMLLLPPYHPGLAERPETHQELQQTEQMLRDEASALGIRVVGSFDATTIGCGSIDFRDWIHPTEGCFDRVFENGPLN